MSNRAFLFLVGCIAAGCLAAATPGFAAPGVIPVAAPGADAVPPVLDRSVFEPHAAGRWSLAPGEHLFTNLRIARSGRYSLRASSAAGARIELVDRMMGTLAAAGSEGRTDGRIDRMLQPGEYRVRVYPGRGSEGRIVLSAQSFSEQNFEVAVRGADPAGLPHLPRRDLVSSTLEDLQTRSYWLHVPEDTVLHLEAIGRRLSGCTIWRDGLWREPDPFIRSVRFADTGKPLIHWELNQALSAGHYLLVCSGGPGVRWAEESPAAPLYLRRGVRRLGDAGDRELTISPFGTEVFLVSGRASFFEVSRPDLAPTSLSVSPYDPSRSRYSGGSRSAITRESRDPWCTVRTRPGREEQWVVVEAAPGDRVALVFFEESLGYQFPQSGRGDREYWVSSLQSAAGADAIDITPMVLEFRDMRVLEHSPVRIGPDTPLVRRVNLLGENNVYLTVEEAGTYRVLETEGEGSGAAGGSDAAASRGGPVGASGLYRFLLLDSQVTPSFQPAGERFELAAGTYIFHLRPERRGILRFVLYREDEQAPGRSEEAARRLLRQIALHSDERIEPRFSARTSFVWPRLMIPSGGDEQHGLVLNERSGVAAGLVVRELPLDLTLPLPVPLGPGESFEAPLLVHRDSVLDVDGRARILLDGSPIRGGDTVEHGPYTLSIENPRQERTVVSLALASAELASKEEARPRPMIKDPEQSFPLITEDDPVYADYDRGQSRLFLLRVARPALYSVETSGRLAMRLKVRTALDPALFEAAGNGVGRNARIQTYLRPGLYLVEAGTTGRSRGRAGLHLQRSPVAQAGRLPIGSVRRATVRAGSALVYSFAVEEPGEYRITTDGLGTEFPFRLEDDGGWPIGQTPGTGTVEHRLAPGNYRYFTLPVPLESRRLTRLSEVSGEQPPAEQGRIELNRRIEGTWRESPGRDPIVYALELPAPVRATVRLSEGMIARLEGPGLDDGLLIRGGRDHRLSLERGSTAFSLRSIEENDRFPFTLAVSTADLVQGLRQTVSRVPADVPVSVGEEGHVDIWSFGRSDVRASLWDADGAVLLARNDDSRNDWNFLISERLDAGRYTLRVEKVGHWGGAVTVHMEGRKSRTVRLASRGGGGRIEERIGRTVLHVPFRTGDRDGLHLITARAASPVSLELTSGGRALASGDNRITIPLRRNTDYAVRLWHRADAELDVSLEVLPAAETGSGDVRELMLNGAPVEAELSAFTKLVDPTGLSFRVRTQAGGGGDEGQGGGNRGEGEAPLYSPGPDRPCGPFGQVPLATEGGAGWLVLPRDAWGTVRIEPVSLGPDDVVELVVGDAPRAVLVSVRSEQAVLLEAESPSMTPGIAVRPAGALTGGAAGVLAADSAPGSSRGPGGAGGAGGPGVVDWSAMAVEAGRARTAVVTSGTHVVWLWPVEWTGGYAREGRVRLSVRPFPIRRTVRLPADGSLHVSADAGEAIRVVPDRGGSFGSGIKGGVLSLLLSQGLVALVSGDGGLRQVVAAPPDRNASVLLPVSGGRLTLVNTSAASSLARLELVEPDRDGSAGGGEPSLSADAPFERLMRTAGTVSLDVKPGAGGGGRGPDGERVLYVAGDGVEAVLRGADGRYHRGHAVEGRPYRAFPARSGSLLVRYQPGYVKAWIASPDDRDRGFVGGPGRAGSAASTPAPGSAARGFTLDRPAFVLIGSRVPGVLALYTVGASGSGAGQNRENGDAVDVAASGRTGEIRILRHIPAGSYRAVHRPFGRPFVGAAPEQVPSIDRIEPVRLAAPGEAGGEGGRVTGDLRLIGPGEVHAYSFQVREPAKVGVGLDVDRDFLTARVYDSEFRLVGEGPIVFAELEAAPYFLVVEGAQVVEARDARGEAAWDEGEPVMYRPIVLGLDGSLRNAPEEALRRYREEAGQ